MEFKNGVAMQEAATPYSPRLLVHKFSDERLELGAFIQHEDLEVEWK